MEYTVAKRNSEILLKLVGIRVMIERSDDKFYEDGMYFRSIECKTITSANLYYNSDSSAFIVLWFSDHTTLFLKSFNDSNFDKLIGKVGEFGSIKEMLVSEDFKFQSISF